MTKHRIGFGYDIHRLAEGEELWLGGLLIPHHKGSVGHSDADVLIHAICDALLGAISLGDIGMHFPDTDPKWKGVDSKLLLKEVLNKVLERDYSIGNIDATICLEKPKLRPHIDAMRSCLASILAIDIDDLSIKATTSEKMSFVGTEAGIKAYAVVLLYKD
ncbi:MAG: 2-C-methyl-D-erythritol 2,4-cyclodiphosphate synthase [Saprospiraceae bacterium]|nr:2-C-methyl-D-erythritol 2,4-cyclodiphosphate synthase [Saprospiraceae bacterium]